MSPKRQRASRIFCAVGNASSAVAGFDQLEAVDECVDLGDFEARQRDVEFRVNLEQAL